MSRFLHRNQVSNRKLYKCYLFDEAYLWEPDSNPWGHRYDLPLQFDHTPLVLSYVFPQEKICGRGLY